MPFAALRPDRQPEGSYDKASIFESVVICLGNIVYTEAGRGVVDGLLQHERRLAGA